MSLVFGFRLYGLRVYEFMGLDLWFYALICLGFIRLGFRCYWIRV